jgi:histidyl-tRNA synthetase
VRGLDYYRRTVFEIQPQEEGAQSTIGGGGRYDGLIEQLGGEPTPAIGFATGIERIILNLKRQNVAVPPNMAPRFFLACLGETAALAAFKLAAEMRRGGIPLVQSLSTRSLKAQLRQASGLGVKYALILGESELEKRTIILRDMAGSEQRLLPRDGLSLALKEL